MNDPINVNNNNAANQIPILEAARNGLTYMVNALIIAGAIPDIQDIENGTTALMLSVINNHEETMEALIDAGANLNIQDFSGNTALMYAQFLHNQSMIDTLSNAGAYR